MSVWDDLGFSENPFSTSPIPSNEDGRRLLVGREKELKHLQQSITSSANHSTIEGDNGVGKTSLVQVAGFNLKDDYNKGKSSVLYMMLDEAFQITPSDTAATFSSRAINSIALNVLKYQTVLERYAGTALDTTDIAKWIREPVISGGGANASVAGFGVGQSRSNSANTSSGFSSAGFEYYIKDIMKRVFPDSRSGGFICLIDNIELLDTSQRARQTLEELRDGVLSFPGVKWVLCGSRGIVRSVVSTSRLQGKLAEPIELSPLRPEHVTSVVRERLQMYKKGANAYSPVEADGFAKVYEIGGRNLRVSLKYCEDFAMWCEREGNRPSTEKEKIDLLDVWFALESEKILKAADDVTPRAWKLFDAMAERTEGCSPGDFEEFGFNNGPAMQPHLRRLEQARLINSSADDTDKRRKTISLTPLGWIVHYSRNGYQLPN